MYDDARKETILDNLGNKIIDIVDVSIVLASQGYLVNKNKHTKLDWSSVLLHAFDNIHILSSEQQHRVELLYNKISAL